VTVGTAVQGDLSLAGDVDVFGIQLTGGQVVEVALFATRADQATWDAVSNLPRLTLYDTDANLNDELLQHDFSGNKSNGWPASGGFHDLDIPMFLVPATGTYYVAVTQDDDASAGGRYVVRVKNLTVTNLQQEAEAIGTDGANDTANTAETITPGTVHGYHVAGGSDFYQFTVAADTVISLEMVAMRNGTSGGDLDYYDPYLELFDSTGVVSLADNDDAYIFDSAIQFLADTAGTYVVQVSEFSGGNAEYFLKFSTSSGSATAEAEPNDDVASANTITYGGRVSGDIDDTEVDFFTFDGTAGDMIRLQRFDFSNYLGATDTIVVTLLDSTGTNVIPTGGDFEFQTQTSILPATGTYVIRVEPVALPLPTAYVLGLTRFKAAAAESEPNDDIANATPLGTIRSGAIDSIADEDVYSLTLTANQFTHIVCYATNGFAVSSDGAYEYSGHGSDCSPFIEILDDTGSVAASWTTDPSDVFTESLTDQLPTCAIAGVPDTSGTYYLRITDVTGGGGPTFTYVIEMR